MVNPRSSQSIYAPLNQNPGARPRMSRRELIETALLAIAFVGFVTLGITWLIAGVATSGINKKLTLEDAQRAPFIDPVDGPATIEAKIRSIVHYEAGMLMVGFDGAPETAVSANTAWAVECNGQGLKVHVAMATEGNVEDGGNGFYLSIAPYTSEQCKTILPVMISTMKAVVAGK